MVRTRHLEIRIVLLPLPLDRKYDVVGIEVARRLERLGRRMPLHALAQLEGIGGAVRRDRPFFCEGRHYLRAAALELDDAIVDRLIAVERRAGGVDARVEVLRAALRAENQGFGRSSRSKHKRRSANGGEQNGSVHCWNSR